MQITKPFYVIYDAEKTIIDLGLKQSGVFTGQKYAEFDTLSELNTFVETEGLKLPEEPEEV